MLRQLIIYALVAAVAFGLARLVPPANEIARSLRYCLYLVGLAAAGVLLWIILAATLLAE